MLKSKIIVIFWTFLVSVALNLSIVEAIEITSMKEIQSEITPDTLVLMDLDDTCVTTFSMLGNTPWWDHFTKKMLNAQFDVQTTYKVVFPLVGKILANIPLIPIEEATPQIIRDMQNEN